MKIISNQKVFENFSVIEWMIEEFNQLPKEESSSIVNWTYYFTIDWKKEKLVLEYKQPTAYNKQCSRLYVFNPNIPYHKNSYVTKFDDEYLIAMSDEFDINQQFLFLNDVLKQYADRAYPELDEAYIQDNIKEWKDFMFKLFIRLTILFIVLLIIYLS